jgi:hypothetical protein
VTDADPATAGTSLDDAFAGVAQTLAADGYHAEWEFADGDVVNFRVSASDEACPDCLVPLPVMQAILEGALEGTGWTVGRIDMPSGP